MWMPHLLCQTVETEDGIQLATDIYRPGPGTHPVVLIRTPYHRTGQQASARRFLDEGFAVVVQDCRGKFDSGGEFTPLVDEARDGHAALDWIADQSWCNGRIGMWGRSYLGIVQVPAASTGHEALRCIAPSVAPGSWFRDWLRYDGCFALGNAIRWSLTHASARTQPPLDHVEWTELNPLGSPEEIARHVGFETPILSTWAEHDVDDDYWQSIDQDTMHPSVAIPGFHAGGWFDHLTRGQFNAFANIRATGASSLARDNQHLLIGPWGHQTIDSSRPGRTTYGQWDFGSTADLDVTGEEIRFLNLHLRDIDDGFTRERPVKVFTMGRNRWESYDDWPPPSSTAVTYTLSPGRLVRGPVEEDRVTIPNDPSNPVPTLGGQVYWGLEPRGPVDQRPILGREDVLFFRSEPFARPCTVLDPIVLDLTVSCTAENADLVGKFCVELPDETVICLTVGSFRCCYAQGFDRKTPLVPGESVGIRIDLGHIAYEFPKDARIGLIVAGSDFPRIQTNTGRLDLPWGQPVGKPYQTDLHTGGKAASSLHVHTLDSTA